ncbi:MAG: LD-carboxypeptidase [Candidatus Eisenbacteria bacterium]|nr:LD-carboxypeptidase [Candidatus Eisenbacteria bacterium]
MQKRIGPLIAGPARRPTLGIAAPSSAIHPERFARGIAYLESIGFNCRLGEIVGRPVDRSKCALHAARPDERARELRALVADPEVDAIVAARGGAGALGLLGRLDLAELAASGKCLVGMSDCTALSLPLLAQYDTPSLAGPMVVQLHDGCPETTRTSWRDALLGHTPRELPPLAEPTPTPLTVLTPGRAEGLLIPANLSLLAALVGTPYCPSLDGAILLIEEIDETPSSLDRMFERLRLSGACDRLGGLILGQLTNCLPRDGASIEADGAKVAEAWARSLGVPAIAGFPHGHEALCLTLPVGVPARLETDPGQLTLLDSIWTHGPGLPPADPR